MPASARLLQELFAPLPVPEQLQRLLAFQEEVGYGAYSQSLTLDVDERSGLTHGWSKEPAFLDSLFPFGMATASGSFYALWRSTDSQNPENWPVILFGDEGGEWVVAKDVSDLLAISSFDAEPMVDYREVSFYKDEENHWSSPSIDRYIEWLFMTFGISKVEDPNALVANAQSKLQHRFDLWKEPFLAHKDAASFLESKRSPQ